MVCLPEESLMALGVPLVHLLAQKDEVGIFTYKGQDTYHIMLPMLIWDRNLKGFTYCEGY